MYDTVKPTMTIHKNSMQHRPVVVGDVVADGNVVVCGAAVFNINKKQQNALRKIIVMYRQNSRKHKNFVIFTRMIQYENIRYDMIRYASIRSVVKKVQASLVYHTRS